MSDWSVHSVVICNLGNNMQDICCLPCTYVITAHQHIVGASSFTVSSFHLGQALMEAVALYDCTADHDDELTFPKGEIIREVIAITDGWSKGRLLSTGEYGVFPCNYVKMRRAAPIEHLPPPVGDFSMLSMLTCVLHALLSPVGNTGAVEDKQTTLSFY